MQYQPQYNRYSKPVFQHPPQLPQAKPYRHLHPNQRNKDLPLPLSTRHQQRGHLQLRVKNLNVPRNKLSSVVDSQSNPRKIPSTTTRSPKKSPRQFNAVREGPKVNDVVCCSIFSPKRARRVVAIQPNSTHEGNLRFEFLVRSRAHSYNRAKAMQVSSNSSSSERQKRSARSIAAEIQERGGRFLVWIKRNQDRPEHTNNGSWQLVDREDVCNISRYALLKQSEAIEEDAKAKAESAPPRHRVRDHHEGKSTPNRGESSPILSETKASTPEDKEWTTLKAWHESDDDDSTATSISNSTILNILSEMSMDSEDSLDLWSSSAGSVSSTETKNPKKGQSERLSACCWEYKILLPLTTME